MKLYRNDKSLSNRNHSLLRLKIETGDTEKGIRELIMLSFDH